MRNEVLTARQAVRILMPYDLEPGEVADAQFDSAADVCEALASYFDFTGEDYERLYFEEQKQKFNIDWVLLRQQKLWLVEAIEAYRDVPETQNLIDGLVGLIDKVQDEAVESGVSEADVFGEEK